MWVGTHTRTHAGTRTMHFMWCSKHTKVHCVDVIGTPCKTTFIVRDVSSEMYVIKHTHCFDDLRVETASLFSGKKMCNFVVISSAWPGISQGSFVKKKQVLKYLLVVGIWCPCGAFIPLELLQNWGNFCWYSVTVVAFLLFFNANDRGNKWCTLQLL